MKNEKKRPTEVSTPKISAGNCGVSFKVSLKKEAKPDFFRGYNLICFECFAVECLYPRTTGAAVVFDKSLKNVSFFLDANFSKLIKGKSF
jgi:hypothetical protein